MEGRRLLHGSRSGNQNCCPWLHPGSSGPGFRCLSLVPSAAAGGHGKREWLRRLSGIQSRKEWPARRQSQLHHEGQRYLVCPEWHLFDSQVIGALISVCNRDSLRGVRSIRHSWCVMGYQNEYNALSSDSLFTAEVEG